jgi:hypothetical protein
MQIEQLGPQYYLVDYRGFVWIVKVTDAYQVQGLYDLQAALEKIAKRVITVENVQMEETLCDICEYVTRARFPSVSNTF